jgi:hypothetical protein
MGIWCAVDDIATLRDSRASTQQKVDAGFGLAGFVIPEARFETIAESLVDRFGAGPAKAALGTLRSGGLLGIQRGIRSLEKQIAIHQQKIQEAIKAPPGTWRILSR